MKRLSLKVALFLPIMGIIIAINMHVDSAHIFDSDRYTEKVSEILVNGNNVANLSNYDERLLQKKYIRKIDICPEIIVLGSSRVLQFRKSMYSGKSFFNNGVSGAVLQDYLAIYRLWEKKNCSINKVVLGIDPWIFNDNWRDSRWQTLNQEYKECLLEVTGGNEIETNRGPTFSLRKLKETINIGWKQQSLSIAKIKELVSFEYFKISLKNWNDRFFMTKAEKLEMPLKYSDGSIYEYTYARRDQQTIDQLAKEYSYEDYVNFSQISNYSLNLLDNFLAYLKKKNINVTIFILPYHPITWDDIISKYQIYNEFQSTLKELAKRHGIQVAGSLNPHDFNLKNSDFYDGMHIRPEAIVKVLSYGEN